MWWVLGESLILRKRGSPQLKQIPAPQKDQMLPFPRLSPLTGEALLVHLCLYHPHRAWHRAGILRTVNPTELSEEEGEGAGWGQLRKNS